MKTVLSSTGKPSSLSGEVVNQDCVFTIEQVEKISNLSSNAVVIKNDEECQCAGGEALLSKTGEHFLIIDMDELERVEERCGFEPVVIIPVSELDYAQILLRLYSKYGNDVSCYKDCSPAQIINDDILYETVFEELFSDSLSDLISIVNNTRSPWLDALDVLNSGSLTDKKVREIALIAYNSNEESGHLESVRSLLASKFKAHSEAAISPNEPPVMLVKTWVGLLTSNYDKEVKNRAKKMLIDAFGSIKAAAEFCSKNNISVK